jgi:hypothetical protein
MVSMHSFRPLTPDAVPERELDLLTVGQLIDAAMRPGHFYADPQLHLTWIAARSETIAWEIFRGRLLDASQTRLRKTFLSWHLLQEDETNPAPEPMISVKFDVHERQIHVTRGLLSYVWEGYDAGGGVIESRETIRWTRELVSTILLEQFADLANLRDELICVLWQAVVGTSRLPLTSVEAPLPASVFGQFHYAYQSDLGEGTQPIEAWEELLQRGLRPGLAWREYVKLVEVALRRAAPEDLPRSAELILARVSLPGFSLPRLLRALFNDVSLSPYTRYVDNALAWVDLLVERGALTMEEKIDVLGYLLRLLGRHLTAYDLVTFHHRGANYPDALLLDAALNAYVGVIDARPERFSDDDAKGRLRRRALRQGCLMRRYYEGHLVPDLPTSPGENARVMPASHPRVPEEQLLQPQRRRRQLFADDPLTRRLTEGVRVVLAQSVRDLEQLDERADMGTGLFVDRPLGYAKPPAEPDLTPLLAHEAFSPSLAQRRWQELQRLGAELCLSFDQAGLQSHFQQGAWPAGLPHAELAKCPRPAAALTDVRQVADDFVVLRTLPGGAAEFMQLFDWRALAERFSLRFLGEGTMRLCVQVLNHAQQPVLAFYDAQVRRRLEMIVDVAQGYARRAGVEVPRAGLRVATVWEDTDDPALLVRRQTTEAVRTVRA